VLDIHTFISVHPGLTLGAIATIVVLQSYLFYDKWRRRGRFEAKLATEIARTRGVPFASRPLWQRAKRGTLFTAIIPGACSVPILLWCAFGGRYQKIDRNDALNADLLELGLFYLLGSIWLGATIAVCAPLMRGFVSRSLIGMAAVAPLIGGIAWALKAWHWESFDTVLSVSMSVFFGIAIGHGVRRGQALTTRSSKKDPLKSPTAP
jgi:hypothetical protein